MFVKFAATAFLSAIFLISGCGPSEESGSNVNSESERPSPSAAPSEDALGGIEKTPTPAQKVEAVTLKPVVDAFCNAMRKRDEAGLRKVYSQATLRSFEADMRADGIDSLSELLSTEPVGDKCEVVNERIQGNLGEALVITKTYPNGVMIKFVKENNDWKMTNQSSDFDAVRNSTKK
jgi:hypothetical protein